MDSNIDTSVASVRTVLQHHHDQPGGSQTRRELHVLLGGGASGDSQGSSSSGETFEAGSYSGRPSPRVHALVLPSPPDSPGGSPNPSVGSASESSLPSVSSSFFFSSSAAGSPGRSNPSSWPPSYPQSDHEHEYADHEHNYGHGHRRHQGRGLIIPSLELPAPLRRPTPFGQTLGTVRLLVLGAQGVGKSFLTGLLLEDNEDVVDVGTWADWTCADAGADVYGKVLHASTAWVEHPRAFGAERFEPARNVEIVELPGYAHDVDGSELISRMKSIIEAPFRALHDVLHPDATPSGPVASLLASPQSPLYTALLFLLPNTPSPLDATIISALSPHIPLIVLPRLREGGAAGIRTWAPGDAQTSAFRPASPAALRTGLFRAPETAALLRAEAVARFLRWREVETAVAGVWEGSLGLGARGTSRGGLARRGSVRRGRKLGEREWGRGDENGRVEGAYGQGGVQKEKSEVWNKARWEAEWMADHAQEVARRVREEAARNPPSGRARTGTVLPPLQKSLSTSAEPTKAPPAHAPRGLYTAFDPLHLPSLLVFSVSLLGPLRVRVWASLRSAVEGLGEARVQAALLGGFCVGIGAGMWVVRS